MTMMSVSAIQWTGWAGFAKAGSVLREGGQVGRPRKSVDWVWPHHSYVQQKSLGKIIGILEHLVPYHYQTWEFSTRTPQWTHSHVEQPGQRGRLLKRTAWTCTYHLAMLIPHKLKSTLVTSTFVV